MSQKQTPNAHAFNQSEFKLDPQKEAEFYKIVDEKYGGDLHLALGRAVDYFLMHEKSRSLKQVSETLREIQGKISHIREMTSQLSTTVKDINETNAKLQEKRTGEPNNLLPPKS
jgi:septal ring factor EnvC (AmiA/AmiB activator)